MESSEKESGSYRAVRRYTYLLCLTWMLTVLIFLAIVLIGKYRETLEIARTYARAAFEKDVLYRRWNAIHNGVYAPVTSGIRPNPYLNVPERDITTNSGRALTLINPAFMTRQVHELGLHESGIQGHITSLKPIRPENVADPWETSALRRFEQGETEVTSVEKMEGTSYMRLMRPLITEKGCLKCHAEQGYVEGQIRGGISTSVPMAPLWDAALPQMLLLAIIHVILLVLGISGIVWGSRHLQIRIRESEEAKAHVRTLQGILPICMHCHKIRNDEESWERLESYIQDRMDVTMSHGLCTECFEKYYSESESDEEIAPRNKLMEESGDNEQD